MRAFQIIAFENRRFQTLARQLQQAELRDARHLGASLIALEGLPQRLFNLLCVLDITHVDKINHDQTTEVAQTQLARNFLRCLHVRLKGGLLNAFFFGRAPGIHIDGHQSFCGVNDNRPP